MTAFHIVTEGVNGYSVGKFWEDEAAEMYASRGGTTDSSSKTVCVLSWKPNDIYIVGGPKLMAHIDACIDAGGSAALKELCWDVVIENMTPEMLRKAMESRFEAGVSFGNARRLTKIREALEINY